MEGSDKNAFLGSDQHVAMYMRAVTIPSGESWTIPSSNDVALYLHSLNVYGTLNLGSGLIVKNENSSGQPSIHVYDGGSVNANGTAASPVIFTSSYDDAVGGDIRADGLTVGSAGDYPMALSAENGTSVAFNYVAIRYAAGAVRIAGEANFSSVSVYDVTDGITASAGSRMTYRGSFDNIGGRAIYACSWGANCAVDAAYVDWGTADGPFASNPDDNKACGQVTVTPWVNEADANLHMFDILNCDNSPTISDSTASAAGYFNSRLAARGIDCSNGMQSACDAIDTALSCFSGARDVALSTSPWPLPPADTATQIGAFNNLMLDGAATYVMSKETVTVSGFALGLFNEVIKVAGTMVTMASAYNNCAP